MVNIAYVVPRILGFRQIINEIFETRSVRTAQGEGSQIAKAKPCLKIDIGFVDPSGDINGGESYTFGSEAAELASVEAVLAAAGVDVKAAWETAFDVVKERFTKTKDQTGNAKLTGIAWYLRVDAVTANLNPTGPMGLSMTIGCYRDSAYTKIASMFEIGFFDTSTMTRRAEQIAQIEANIEQLESMVAGTHASQIDLRGEEAEKSKRRAANDLVINNAQLVQQRNALAAPLADVLGLPAVQSAFTAVAQAVYTELRGKLVEWSDIDVAELMKTFGPRMMEVATA
jgi:hypothetical protein